MDFSSWKDLVHFRQWFPDNLQSKTGSSLSSELDSHELLVVVAETNCKVLSADLIVC